MPPRRPERPTCGRAGTTEGPAGDAAGPRGARSLPGSAPPGARGERASSLPRPLRLVTLLPAARVPSTPLPGPPCSPGGAERAVCRDPAQSWGSGGPIQPASLWSQRTTCSGFCVCWRAAGRWAAGEWAPAPQRPGPPAPARSSRAIAGLKRAGGRAGSSFLALVRHSDVCIQSGMRVQDTQAGLLLPSLVLVPDKFCEMSALSFRFLLDPGRRDGKNPGSLFEAVRIEIKRLRWTLHPNLFPPRILFKN